MGKKNVKYTLEEVREIVRSKGFELVSDEYVNCRDRLVYRDNEGYYYKTSLNSIIIVKHPDRFNINNPYTIQNIKLWLSINYSKFTLITNVYTNCREKIIIKCDKNFYYAIRFDVLLRGEYPECFHRSNPYTIQNIKLWCKINNKPFELLSDKYEGNNLKLKWECLKEDCKEVFESNWAEIFQNKGCSFCSGHQVGLSNCLATKNPLLAIEWHSTLNGELTPYDITCGNSSIMIWWKCKECGYKWVSNVCNRNIGNGCPSCNKSRGEKFIKGVLEFKNKIFDMEYDKFSDLLSNLGNPLRFDFAIFTDETKNNIEFLCEFDGIQHFE